MQLRGGVVTEDALPCARDLVFLSSGERGEESVAHAGEMGRRAGRESIESSIGDAREDLAAVAFSRAPFDETFALKALNQPCDACAAEQSRIGQLGHSHLVARREAQLNEDVVRAQREAMSTLELGVELFDDARVHAEEPEPCSAFVGV